MSNHPDLPDEHLAKIAGTIVIAVRKNHPDLSADEIAAAWIGIGELIPLAFTLHDAVETGVNQAMSALKRGRSAA